MTSVIDRTGHITCDIVMLKLAKTVCISNIKNISKYRTSIKALKGSVILPYNPFMSYMFA